MFFLHFTFSIILETDPAVIFQRIMMEEDPAVLEAISGVPAPASVGGGSTTMKSAVALAKEQLNNLLSR